MIILEVIALALPLVLLLSPLSRTMKAIVIKLTVDGVAVLMVSKLAGPIHAVSRLMAFGVVFLGTLLLILFLLVHSDSAGEEPKP